MNLKTKTTVWCRLNLSGCFCSKEPGFSFFFVILNWRQNLLSIKRTWVTCHGRLFCSDLRRWDTEWWVGGDTSVPGGTSHRSQREPVLAWRHTVGSVCVCERLQTVTNVSANRKTLSPIVVRHLRRSVSLWPWSFQSKVRVFLCCPHQCLCAVFHYMCVCVI